MGIVTFFKPIISWLLLYSLYFGGITTGVLSIFRRAEWGLLLLVALIPQPNVWYKLYELPYGKDFLDFLLLCILAGIFVNKKGFAKNGNTFIVLFFLILSYVSVWISSINFSLPAPVSGDSIVLRVWKSYAFMIFFYFLTLNAVVDEKRQRQIIAIMALVVIFVSIKSIRNFTAGASFVDDSRDPGPFWIVGLGSNHYGAFIAYCFSFFLGMFFMEKDRKSKLLYLAAIILSLQPLFFSYSRGAYLAVFCVLLVYGVLKTRKLLLVILLIVTLWQVVLPASVVERISMTETDSGELESSAAVRLTLWDNAVKMFYEYPILGSGFKGFTIAHIKEHWSDTHNFYLKTLCEQGIIGIILLFLILAAALRSGWRLFKSGTTPFQKGLGYGFLGCVIAHIITNLFGDRFSYYEMGSYFWIFWGAVDRGLLMVKSAEQQAVAEETIPALEDSRLPA